MVVDFNTSKTEPTLADALQELDLITGNDKFLW